MSARKLLFLVVNVSAVDHVVKVIVEVWFSVDHFFSFLYFLVEDKVDSVFLVFSFSELLKSFELCFVALLRLSFSSSTISLYLGRER
jgi:hypothetical protein